MGLGPFKNHWLRADGQQSLFGLFETQILKQLVLEETTL